VTPIDQSQDQLYPIPCDARLQAPSTAFDTSTEDSANPVYGNAKSAEKCELWTEKLEDVNAKLAITGSLVSQIQAENGLEVGSRSLENVRKWVFGQASQK